MSFRVSDLETLLRKVELKAQDLGTFLSREGMKKLHTETALGRWRAGSNGFTHQLGGHTFLAFSDCTIIRELAHRHIMQGVNHLHLDLTGANELRHRKANLLQPVRANVVRSLVVPGIDTSVHSYLEAISSESEEGRIRLNDSVSRHMKRVISTDLIRHGKER